MLEIIGTDCRNKNIIKMSKQSNFKNIKEEFTQIVSKSVNQKINYLR